MENEQTEAAGQQAAAPKAKKQPKGLTGGAKLVLTVILTFIAMVAACLAVFFLSVQGKEQVMVPNVVGKDLTSALLELQARELYGKVQLRYSDLPGHEGTILEQDPKAGAIIKAYQRVTITVDRGVAIDRLEDYTGQQVDEVRTRLQLLFSGSGSVVTVAQPVYTQNSAPAGTILAQYPAAGTIIGQPMTVRLVVSSGTQTATTEVPQLEGLTIAQVLRLLEGAQVTVDFSQHVALSGEQAGTVTRQGIAAGTSVQAFSRVTADVALAEPQEGDATVRGVFTYEAADYPYAVPMQLDARDEDGNTTTIVQLSHPGKTVTIPYAVKRNSTLIFSILGEEKYRATVQ